MSNIAQQGLGDEGNVVESITEIYRAEILTQSNFVT